MWIGRQMPQTVYDIFVKILAQWHRDMKITLLVTKSIFPQNPTECYNYSKY